MKSILQKWFAAAAIALAAAGPWFSQIALPVAAPSAATVAAAAISATAALTAPSTAQATDLTNYTENKVIDWLFRGQTFTPPATIYVGLLTGACSDASAGTEVTGGSYARVAVTSSLANWAGTQSAGSTIASSGSGGTTSNNAAITFPVPSAAWGSVVNYGLWDASTSGNLLVCTALAFPKSINNGDPAPQFIAGTLTFRIDN